MIVREKISNPKAVLASGFMRRQKYLKDTDRLPQVKPPLSCLAVYHFIRDSIYTKALRRLTEVRTIEVALHHLAVPSVSVAELRSTLFDTCTRLEDL